MGIFGESASPFDEILEKVTAEHQTTENWALILEVCDRINSDSRAPRPAIVSIRKRLNNRDPHVIMLALSVLDSCWSNCGPVFRREISSASFISELTSKATHSSRPIAEKTRLMVKKWSENECKSDSSLSLINTMYRNLILDGYSFESSEPKKKQVISNDPNTVSSQEEEDAIAKAIALSLQDSEKQKKTTGSSLYGTLNGNGTCSNGISGKSTTAERTVRALYDFEAAEDNELSFVTGDLITVTDDSNPNWWNGRIGVQQGLFPSSFVTSDLTEVKQENNNEIQAAPVAVIDESILLKCIQLLEDCDPSGETPDPPELAATEAAAEAQRPLIEARLTAIDKQSDALAQVDIAIRDVLALYDQAVQQANPYQQQMGMYNQQPNQSMAGIMPSSQPTPQIGAYPAPYAQNHMMPQQAPMSTYPGYQYSVPPNPQQQPQNYNYQQYPQQPEWKYEVPNGQQQH